MTTVAPARVVEIALERRNNTRCQVMEYTAEPGVNVLEEPLVRSINLREALVQVGCQLGCGTSERAEDGVAEHVPDLLACLCGVERILGQDVTGHRVPVAATLMVIERVPCGLECAQFGKPSALEGVE